MKTREKRIIVSLAFVFALGLGTQALALDELDVKNNDVNVAQDEAQIVNDSVIKQDNSEDKTQVDVKVDDSFNDKTNNSNQDNSEDKTIIKVKADDSFNTNNSNQDNSEDKTQIAVEDSLNDNSKGQDNSEDKSTDSFNDTAKAKDNGVALVDSEDVAITKDSFNGNIGEMEGGNVAATTGGTASMTDSFNIDNSVNTTADRGGIAVGGIASEDEVDVEITKDSYNNKAEDGSAAVYGSGSAEVASHNTINSGNTDVTVGNVAIEIATSVLAGEVSGNTFTAPEELTFTTGANTLGATGAINATGITVISQNTGVQAQVQQAVTVQYNGAIPQ